ncbi:EF-hand domain-containing protein [uncultured Croceicoccus sp.]|uniref:EF-hand domain-containing protein n=1 Tax=uncultured Croceicoccus sp. TaxID=1295329 RepID=UPI0026344F7A|nr:EF-hand domain-containing protein [uncultured Croceicoccus sp.]
MRRRIEGRTRKRVVPALLLPLMMVGALSACGEKNTGPQTEVDDTTAPDVASPVPAATENPDGTRRMFSFDGLDADGNGFISSAEYAQGWSRTFEAMDSDGDGTLTVEELDAARTAIGRLSTLSSERLIELADQDNTGTLTLAEYVGAANTNFQRRDLDGDGHISREEWERSGSGEAETLLPQD